MVQKSGLRGIAPIPCTMIGDDAGNGEHLGAKPLNGFPVRMNASWPPNIGPLLSKGSPTGSDSSSLSPNSMLMGILPVRATMDEQAGRVPAELVAGGEEDCCAAAAVGPGLGFVKED